LKLDLDALLNHRDIDARTLGHPTSHADAKSEFDWSVVSKSDQTLIDLVNLVVELYGTSPRSFGLSPWVPVIPHITLPNALKLGEITETEYYIHMIRKCLVRCDRTHNISGIGKQTGFHKIRNLFYWKSKNALCRKFGRMVSR